MRGPVRPGSRVCSLRGRMPCLFARSRFVAVFGMVGATSSVCCMCSDPVRSRCRAGARGPARQQPPEHVRGIGAVYGPGEGRA